MEQLYSDVSFRISELITKTYSTSFSKAVGYLSTEKKKAIQSIYGFVRVADEIVDTFHNHDKKLLLDKFESDYYEALEKNISLNPVLHSFQQVVKKYNIPDDLVRAFLKSMKSDLGEIRYNNRDQINKYVFGSAEVVGLMCLMVFVDGNKKLYEELRNPAMKLGAAFQKVNFLRDLKNDTELLDRNYFPEIGAGGFDDTVKKQIEKDIENDFAESRQGIIKLPDDARLPVMIAYFYFKKLLDRISRVPAERILETRIRVPDSIKLLLLVKAYFVHKFNLMRN
ncbi:MAG: squalene/phytoene synthase family protein [Bacteroidales bacterium]|nr:squalene/phytoene synthase family protein [Bacteroidales bacterium]